MVVAGLKHAHMRMGLPCRLQHFVTICARHHAKAELTGTVVAHGDILRHIADARPSSRQWDNAENKVFTFASEDPELPLKEVDDADEVEPKDATKGPTSSEID